MEPRKFYVKVPVQIILQATLNEINSGKRGDINHFGETAVLKLEVTATTPRQAKKKVRDFICKQGQRAMLDGIGKPELF